MSVDLGDEQVVLERVVIREAFSEPFEITVDILSEHGEIDLRPHLGNEIKIKVEQAEMVRRLVHGHVVEGMYIGEAKAGWRYRLTVRPWTHFMDANIQYRIYQELSVKSILQETFAKAGISDIDLSGVNGASIKRTYCVQYGESDFDFASRLMEEEGIYYYFRHEESRHVMMLCDTATSHSPGNPDTLVYNHNAQSMVGALSYDEGFTPFVTQWVERVRTSARSKVETRDWDFRRPQKPLSLTASIKSQHARDSAEVYLGASKFVLGDEDGDAHDAKKLPAFALDAARVDRAVYTGLSQSLELATGYKVKVEEHPADRFNAEYLIIGTHHTIVSENYRSGEGHDYHGDLEVAFEAIPASTVFRPQLRTPRPIVRGLESAIVTGPAGEVLHTDEFGRVKVQFHWDRDHERTEDSSCWIRVSQTGGLGNVILPRIGHEVLVDFLGGDPDRPVVVGRVFNAEHMPIYPLPDNRTMATWRTKTVGAQATLTGVRAVGKKDEGGDKKWDWEDPEANEMRFEDKAGKEEIYLHANRDLNTRVRHCETRNVGLDETISIGQNRTETVWKDEKVTIKGKRDYTLTGDETEIIEKGNRKTTLNTGNVELILDKGNRTTTLSMGNEKLDVKMGNITVKAAMGKIEMEAMQSIELKVGQSSILIDQMGVTIKGMMLKSEAQIMNTLKGTMTTTEGSAMMTVKGAITMIN